MILTLSLGTWLLPMLGHLSPLALLILATFGSIACSFYIGVESEVCCKTTPLGNNFPLVKLTQGKPSILREKPISPSKIFSRTSKSYKLYASQSDLDELPELKPLSDEDGVTEGFTSDFMKPEMSQHYVCPPTSLEVLRKKYGTRKSLWGEWSSAETRQFYKSQLPKALQIDGALGLSLEERAKLASEARYALKIYSRERCYLPGRIFARLYDGIRHWQDFGYWSTEGMTWPEVKLKYSREARKVLGENATDDQIIAFVYRRIVDRACSTNGWIDHLADKKMLDVVGANVELILNQKKDKEPIPSLDENEYSFDFYDSTNSESESSLSLEPSLAVVIPIIVIPWIHKHIVNNMLLHKLKHLFSV